MKRLFSFMAVLVGLFGLASIASAQTHYVTGTTGSSSSPTSTSWSYGDKFSSSVTMTGHSYAEGGSTAAGSQGYFNWAAPPIEVNGEMVSPSFLTAGFNSQSEGTQYSEAGGNLAAKAVANQEVSGKEYIDPSRNLYRYSGAGTVQYDLAAKGSTYGDQANIGAVGQYTNSIDMGNVQTGVSGFFAFQQQGEGVLEGIGGTAGGVKFKFSGESWSYER